MRKLWILPALLVLFFASCQRKKCLTYGIGGFDLKKKVGTVTDSSVTVYRFVKNGSFTSVVDSYSSLRTILPEADYFFGLPWSTMENGGYDYKVRFYPSQRTLYFSNIYAENNTGSSAMSCVNPVHSTVNDTVYTVDGYVGMQSFYLPVEY